MSDHVAGQERKVMWKMKTEREITAEGTASHTKKSKQRRGDSRSPSPKADTCRRRLEGAEDWPDYRREKSGWTNDQRLVCVACDT